MVATRLGCQRAMVGTRWANSCPSCIDSSAKLMIMLPMEALGNALYGSWRPLTNLTQTFQACHLCTFNVATNFS